MAGATDTSGLAALCRELARLAATDTGRGTEALSVPVRNDLYRSALALTQDARSGRVLIVTGFFIPRADPPTAETDGPLGAALLAYALSAIGTRSMIVTDQRCESVVQGALAAARELSSMHVDPPQLKITDGQMSLDGIAHLIAVERVGRTRDGSYRNMLGQDISAHTDPLDEAFLHSHVARTGIGDGGNEIGMGRLDAGLVAEVVTHGELVHSVIDCEHLIVSGTSNWGAHALAIALAALTGSDLGWLLAEDWSHSVLAGSVSAGAVDGVTTKREQTVDGLSWEQYWRVPAMMGAIHEP